MRGRRMAQDEWGRETRLEPLIDDNELPSRLEVGQPGWRRFAGRIKVVFDGEDRTRRCTAFDTNKGLIRLQREDEQGRIFLEHGNIATQTLRGKVEVRWR